MWNIVLYAHKDSSILSCQSHLDLETTFFNSFHRVLLNDLPRPFEAAWYIENLHCLKPKRSQILSFVIKWLAHVCYFISRDIEAIDDIHSDEICNILFLHLLKSDNFDLFRDVIRCGQDVLVSTRRFRLWFNNIQSPSVEWPRFDS